jgi:hypothetical protein
MDHYVQRVVVPGDGTAQIPLLVGLGHGPLEYQARAQELTTRVDEGPVRADGEGRDDRPLDQLVRVSFNQFSVVERARLGLVEVHDEVRGLARVLRHECPLLPGREPRPTAPAQAGRLDLLDHVRRVHSERLVQRLVAARLDVAVDGPHFVVTP